MGSEFGFLFIAIVIAGNARLWLAHERGRQMIIFLAAFFCILLGPSIIAIAIATAREEYGYGTLTGGPHGDRMLFLTMSTGVAGFAVLVVGCYLLLSRRRLAR